MIALIGYFRLWREASVSCDAMTCRLSGQSGLSHVVRPSEFRVHAALTLRQTICTHYRSYLSRWLSNLRKKVSRAVTVLPTFLYEEQPPSCFAIERGGPFTPDAGNRLIKRVG